MKNWRKKHNLTQLELAHHLRVDRATVGRWEVGLRSIPPFLFLALEAIENRLMKGGGKNRTKTNEKKTRRKEVKKHGKNL